MKTDAELKKEAWIYKTEPYWYEYHIESVGFFTEVHAGSAAQARIKGWEAYQLSK